LPFDTSVTARAHQGSLNYHAGLAAEDGVVLHYLMAGAKVIARRWRGRAGEVDLVLRLDDLHLFVEVKKSVTFAMAAERLGAAQLSRVASAAEEYMDALPDDETGFMRIDAALVDEMGRVEIIENVTL
jgi:putative endonuclease